MEVCHYCGQPVTIGNIIRFNKFVFHGEHFLAWLKERFPPKSKLDPNRLPS
jgi:hypothetical protein